MYCKNCIHRIPTKSKEDLPYGVCTNNEKIDEDTYQDDKSDMLIYSYMEGGSFCVGDNFGCVHFKSNDT